MNNMEIKDIIINSSLMLPPPTILTRNNRDDLTFYSFKGKSISVPRKQRVTKKTIYTCDINGTIFQTFNMHTNRLLIIKKISILQFKNHLQGRMMLRNCYYQRFFDHHPFVSGFKVSKRKSLNFQKEKLSKSPIDDGTDLYFEFDQSDFTLYQMLRFDQVTTRYESPYIMFQLLTTINYIHSSSVIHRSLDPKTIAVDKEYKIKLFDFSFSISTDYPTDIFFKDYDETPWPYRSPETIIMLKEFSFSCDVWSIGVIFAELILGQQLFRGENRQSLLIEISELIGTPTYDECKESTNSLARNFILNIPLKSRHGGIKRRIPNATQEEIELLEGMLCWNPNKRWTIDRIIRHPYFKTYNHIEQYKCGKKFSLGSPFDFHRLNAKEIKKIIEEDFVSQP
ncbi:hypothetical protein RB653_005728 [Dictyostelium firmibasis]|uniref:Protein kinase domain-containing protein n=1 Tax=Dictyostelium firmibasis TaxID=79012 RepID=A0AAN7YZI7_9MYCE